MRGIIHALMAYTKVLIDGRRRPKTDDEKARISAALAGRKRGPMSERNKRAISDAKRGKPASPGVWRAIRASADVRRSRDAAKRTGGQRGRKRSSEACRNISAGRKGIQFSDEQKAKQSTAAKFRWARGDCNAWRSKLEIRAGLLLEPFGFTPQFRFEFGSSHPFDYGDVDRKVLVEVNGCYWHSHGCLKKDAGEKVKANDAKHRTYAESKGYRVIVLWQCEETNWSAILRTEVDL